MSGIFSCWFNKRKSECEEESLPYKYYLNTPKVYKANGGNMRGSFNRNKNVNTPHSRQGVQRVSEISQSPVYIERHRVVSGASKKIRSYPTSPVRATRKSEDRGYVSDQQARPVPVEGRSIPYRKDPAVVLVANVPQRSSFRPSVNAPRRSSLSPAPNVEHRSSLNPRPEQTKEPFPFHIPEDSVPRRSSLFYGVKYEDYMANHSSRLSAEKPIEDNTMPSTSTNIPPSPTTQVEYINQNNNTKPKKSVSIRVSNADTFVDDAAKTEPVRTTVLRFRPRSSGSFQRPDTVKMMPVRADEVELPPAIPGKYVHRMPVKHSKQQAILATKDGKILQPLKSDKIGRASIMKAEREVRRSFVEPTFEDISKIPQVEELNAITVPEESTRRSLLRSPPHHSILRKESTERNSISRRYSNAQAEDIEDVENQPIPFNTPANTTEVYAVPVIPSRGRSRSILQQSVKSLTSKKYEEPVVSKKNIRYSTATDVFSTHVQRRSVNKSSPNYINMERGQPMLVSELLNPITSIFVSDLKDPVPKDPLTKPSETNLWVKPKNTVILKQPGVQQPPKQSPRVQPVYKEPKQKVYIQRRQSSIYDESSSSEEDYKRYRKKSRPSDKKRSAPYYQQQRIYAAHIPNVSFPSSVSSNGKNPPFKKKGRPSRELCDLNCGEKDTGDYPRMTGSVVDGKSDPALQGTSADDMDLVCYPSERFLQNTPLDTESSSKLRWRIIIKRGEEK